MFRGGFRDDPFFNTGGFNDFPNFDAFFNDRLEPRARRRDERNNHEGHPSNSVEPFRGGIADIFGSMNQMMTQMHRHFDDVQQQMQTIDSNNPNSHCFSSSTFYSYDGRGKEPHVYQAHSSIRTAPGGIKETHKAVKDSRSGEEKMAIGQHIRDKGVVREKRRNIKTKEEDEREDLIGIDHEELPQFTREWQTQPSRHTAIGGDSRRPGGRQGRRDGRAIEAGRRH